MNYLKILSDRHSWPDAALLVLRIAIGVVFIIHGYDKLFGDLGIAGFAGFLAKLGVPFPLFFSWVVSLVEFFGGIAVLVGVWVKPAAALIAIDMVVAFFLVKGGLPKGDLELVLFAMALALVLAGSGKYQLWKK